MGHIDGTTTSQIPTIVTVVVSSPNPEYTNRFTINQLIVTEADSLSFASYDIVVTLWVAIEAQHANTFHSHVIMSIKNQIQRCTKGDKSITNYLFSGKSLVDELAFIDKTLSDDDLTLYILSTTLLGNVKSYSLLSKSSNPLMAQNPVYQTCMKHVSIDIHFVTDLVQQGKLKIQHVSTND
jgi:hypothetical protein